MSDRTNLSRRSFLKSTAAGVAVGSVVCAATESLRQVAVAQDAHPYGGFKMGIQSYSLRGYKATEEALAKTKALGLKYWESFNAHLPLTDDPHKIHDYKKLLHDAGITLMAYGVQPFGKDTDANRKQFEFAKAMGFSVLSADPTPDSFDNLDKLVDEYKVNIAIHNHGPGSRYDSIDSVAKAIMNHSERIGACVDTGHYLRSDVNPVDAIKAFGSRTYGVHLKDVKTVDGKKQFKILGQGDLDTVGCLRELKRLKYEGCLSLEYEENEKNPIADIEHCLAAVRDAVKKLG